MSKTLSPAKYIDLGKEYECMIMSKTLLLTHTSRPRVMSVFHYTISYCRDQRDTMTIFL